MRLSTSRCTLLLLVALTSVHNRTYILTVRRCSPNRRGLLCMSKIFSRSYYPLTVTVQFCSWPHPTIHSPDDFTFGWLMGLTISLQVTVVAVVVADPPVPSTTLPTGLSVADGWSILRRRAANVVVVVSVVVVLLVVVIHNLYDSGDWPKGFTWPTELTTSLYR